MYENNSSYCEQCLKPAKCKIVFDQNIMSITSTIFRHRYESVQSLGTIKINTESDVGISLVISLHITTLQNDYN